MTGRKARELPKSSSFSTPHVQALLGARHLLALLEHHTQEVLREAAHLREAGQNEDLAWLEGALERQALSEAVQVLAAMAAEGAINLLGILVIGQEEFYASLERRPVLEKLAELFSMIEPRNEAVYTQLRSLVANLAQARNSFVHPKPSEGSPPERVGRRADLTSARAAVTETTEVLRQLQSVSPECRMFFHVW